MMNTEFVKNKLAESKQRMSLRGFLDIEIDLFNKMQEIREIKNLIEMGIGGGSKLQLWARAIPDGTVTGLDLYSPEDPSKVSSVENEPKFLRSYHIAKEIESTHKNIDLIWGKNAYDTDAPTVCLNGKPFDKFDVVIDDGDVRDSIKAPYRKKVVHIWKNYIVDEGLLIMEGINGQDMLAPRTLEWHMPVFKEMANQGVVIFDMYEYTTFERASILKPRTNHWFSVWMPNKILYRDVLKKYEHCLVAGSIE